MALSPAEQSIAWIARRDGAHMSRDGDVPAARCRVSVRARAIGGRMRLGIGVGARATHRGAAATTHVLASTWHTGTAAAVRTPDFVIPAQPGASIELRGQCEVSKFLRGSIVVGCRLLAVTVAIV